jgi:hypothetical protein
MVTVVLGARGNVGRHVAAGLQAAGQQVRVTSRNPATAGFSSRMQVAAADLEEAGTLPAALAGAESVFLYARPAGVRGFVEAARAAGVRHVVLLSSAAVVGADAEHNPIARQHRAVELVIEQSGIDWTFIRPGMFAANTRWWWARSIPSRSWRSDPEEAEPSLLSGVPSVSRQRTGKETFGDPPPRPNQRAPELETEIPARGPRVVARWRGRTAEQGTDGREGLLELWPGACSQRGPATSGTSLTALTRRGELGQAGHDGLQVGVVGDALEVIAWCVRGFQRADLLVA